MITKTQRSGLIGAVVALVLLVAVLQNSIDPLRRQPGIEPQSARRALGQIGNTGAALPFEYTLGAVAGFRQVVAGLLWVRADSFFHQGNYDAILPLVRIITWLDPNFLDVYSTGAWHMMYNFTDEDQRSDRRYIPAGLALLREGIRNNPNVYDLYFDYGWNTFDKVQDFDESVEFLQQAMQHNPDYTRVGHILAHALERDGRIDEAMAQWDQLRKDHERVLHDPKSTADEKLKADRGIESATKNLNMMKIRRVARETDTKPPVDAQFSVKVVRVRPRVLEVSGAWNLYGAKNFDQKIWGPVDGARVDVRLQDYGYTLPRPEEFTLEVDPTQTIMVDKLSTRGGRLIRKGSLYMVGQTGLPVVPPLVDQQGVYAFGKNEAPADLGVPLREALAGKAALSPEGRRQLDAITKGKRDAETMAKLEKIGLYVATRDHFNLGKFRREIDMSKDPKMYSFNKDKYELILSFNPRTAPEFVQDRYGWNGEGLTDKHYLDTKTQPGLRMIRWTKVLTRDDILGPGRKVLAQ